MTRWTMALTAMSLALLALITACGEDAGSEPIIEDPWARPGEPGDNSAAYLEIQNDGDEDFTLIDASSDVAQAVEVHESDIEDGMMEMQQVEEVIVPAGESIQLEPGDFHIMMMNLEQALEPGDTFTLTLHFDELDDAELEVTVEEQ